MNPETDAGRSERGERDEALLKVQGLCETTVWDEFRRQLESLFRSTRISESELPHLFYASIQDILNEYAAPKGTELPKQGTDKRVETDEECQQVGGTGDYRSKPSRPLTTDPWREARGLRSGKEERTAAWLVCWGEWIPGKCKAQIVGDILEDCDERRRRGWWEWRIRMCALLELASAMVTGMSGCAVEALTRAWKASQGGSRGQE